MIILRGTLPRGVGELRTSYSSYNAYEFCMEDRKTHPEEYEDYTENEFLSIIVGDEDQQNYQDMLACLDELMEEVNPDGHNWHAEVRNFGWRSLDGETDFQVPNAQEFLRRVLPNADNSFTIYEWTSPDGTRGIAINNSHHDSPRGAEWYFVTPGHDDDDDEEGD